MGHLRLIHSVAVLPAAASECLQAFEKELDYLFDSLRQLGARPDEIEDLVHQVFLALCRDWPALRTTRSMRPHLFGMAFRLVYLHRPQPEGDDRWVKTDHWVPDVELQVLLASHKIYPCISDVIRARCLARAASSAGTTAPETAVEAPSRRVLAALAASACLLVAAAGAFVVLRARSTQHLTPSLSDSKEQPSGALFLRTNHRHPTVPRAFGGSE